MGEDMKLLIFVIRFSSIIKITSLEKKEKS